MLAAFALPAALIIGYRSFAITVGVVAAGWALFAWVGWDTADPGVSRWASMADMIYIGVVYAAACWITYFLATHLPRWLKRRDAPPA